MKRIILLTDYKFFFGLKWGDLPYGSGFDKDGLVEEFKKINYQLEFVPMSQIRKVRNIKDVPVLYTSAEDIGYHYKDYIEDVIYYLELSGAKVIPSYKFLRANNNKVFMEFLRNDLGIEKYGNLNFWCYGTLEEMKEDLIEFKYPIVVKTAKGAMSTGVSLAVNEPELIQKVKAISRSRNNLFQDLKDKLRPYKHKGYKLNSLYRNKFILQSFVPNLKNDWKILIYGDRYFIFSRPVRENDFRASGSGSSSYLYGTTCEFPSGIFDYAKEAYERMDIPHLSIDIAFDGESFYIIEFQALHFGTVGVTKSDVYFVEKENKWEKITNAYSLETHYVNALQNFL
jgi:glutathione synthase/RimK-type ligase-like ATP-grasp enzyme